MILFEKKLFKEIFSSKDKISKKIKQILLNLINFEKLKIVFNKKLFFSKYNLMLWPLIILVLSNHNFLTNIVSKSQYDFNNLVEPASVKKFHSHGNNIEYKTDIQIKNLAKNYEIIFLTGYYSSVYINGEKIFSERNILHFIEDPYKHENNLEKYPLKKININKFIKLGKNEIIILSNNPHSIKKFGLIFDLFIDKQKYKKLSDFNWEVKINETSTDFEITNFDDNIYVKKYSKLFENYREIDQKKQILKLKNNSSLSLLNPYTFLVYIFIVIILLNLFYFFKLSNFKGLSKIK